MRLAGIASRLQGPYEGSRGSAAGADVCDIPGVSQVCDAGQEAVAGPLEWFGSAMAETAAFMYEQTWALFDTTTGVDLAAGGYLEVYNLMFGIGVIVALLLVCLQLLTALVRREPSALARAGTGLARSILGSFLVIAVTGLLLEVTDQLCVAIVHATGNTMDDMGGRLAALVAGLSAINVASPTVGTILMALLGVLAITAAALVWFTLLTRKALLLVAVVFAPIVLAGQSWDATRSWLGRWATFVIALIVSKLVITVIFLVAVTQASAPIDMDLASVSEPLTGIVLMFMAGFAPYLSYKLIALTGLDSYHAITTEQEAKQSLNRPVPIPQPSAVAAAAPSILHATAPHTAAAATAAGSVNVAKGVSAAGSVPGDNKPSGSDPDSSS